MILLKAKQYSLCLCYFLRMLVCNLNIGTYRDAIGYRRHSCGVVIYNQIREKEQLKGTETPLITAGSFD